MSYVDEALACADALGGAVSKLFEPTRAYRRRVDEINARLAGLRPPLESGYVELVRGVAEGRVSDSDVELQAARHAAWSYDGPASKVYVAAAAHCHQERDAAIAAAAPRVFEQLQRLAGSAVEESAKLSASLPQGVTDERSVFKLGLPETAAAWMRLRALVDQFGAVHKLYWVLMRGRWLPGPDGPREEEAAAWATYGDPAKLPKGWAQIAAELRLAAAAAAGARPGLYAWGDALHRWTVWARRTGRVMVQPVAQVNVYDRRGTPVAIPVDGPHVLVDPIVHEQRLNADSAAGVR